MGHHSARFDFAPRDFRPLRMAAVVGMRNVLLGIKSTAMALVCAVILPFAAWDRQPNSFVRQST